jgi:hypothetical protein
MAMQFQQQQGAANNKRGRSILHLSIHQQNEFLDDNEINNNITNKPKKQTIASTTNDPTTPLDNNIGKSNENLTHATTSTI